MYLVYGAQILAWSIARRRTWFSLIGAPLAIGWVAFVTWYQRDGVELIGNYLDRSVVEYLLTSAVQSVGVVAVGILLILPFDALWLTTRVPAPTPEEIALLNDDMPDEDS